MTEMPTDPIYVAARSVLLDALGALGDYRSAVVIVGAQAVYLQTGDAGLSVAPFTRDGDVALDPGPLLAAESPLLGEVMAAAGFALRINTHGGVDPGTWMKTTTVGTAEFSVPVDLIVPLGALPAPGKTRGARLGAHGKTAAMQTRGLEAALVDRQVLTVQGLAPGDTRSAAVAIAGVGALLVAKVIKLQERVAGARLDRQKDKDAGDIYRLIRTTPVDTMAVRLAGLRRDHLAGAITNEAIQQLNSLFRTPRSPGVVMAGRAVEQDVPGARVAAQLTSYIRQLQEQLAESAASDTTSGQ